MNAEELTIEFVDKNKAELEIVAKSLFCVNKFGYEYPAEMTIKTPFGSFTITKQATNEEQRDLEREWHKLQQRQLDHAIQRTYDHDDEYENDLFKLKDGALQVKGGSLDRIRLSIAKSFF